MDRYEKESIVRGHHVYKSVWTPSTGEVLRALIDDNNEYDRHAVAVVKDDQVVGNVPREIAWISYTS